MIFINKKKIAITVSVILGVILAIAGITLLVFYMVAPWMLPWERARSYAAAMKGIDAYESAPPVREIAPDISNTKLHILCDRDAEVLLGVHSTDSNELSRRAKNRNDHFEMELETKLLITSVDDVYATAREDILSGEYEYNMYVAYASDTLSPLLRDDMLYDFSSSVYITDGTEGFDKETSDALSIYGKNYILSSAISDVKHGASVLVYDTSFDDLLTVDGKNLSELAISGELTTEKLFTALKTNNITLPDDTSSASYEATFGEGFTPLAYTEDDIYSIYFALGGSFVDNSNDTLTISPISTVRNGLALVTDFVSNDVVAEKTAKTEYTCSISTVAKASEMKASGKDISILPMPKATADSEYRSYVDLGNTLLCAMPSGIAAPEKRDYLAYRYMALSESYTKPYITEALSENNENNKAILNIVLNSVGWDFAEFFGYGEISSLIGELVNDDERFNLEYYNRKELLEKAFGIIEKRITK